MRRLIIIFLFICPSAFATYTTMTLEGVKQANGVWTASGVMDSMGFVRTTGAVSVAGTTASTAVSLPVERVAAASMLRSTSRFLGPAAMTAMGAYDVYNWITSDPKIKPDTAKDSWYTESELAGQCKNNSFTKDNISLNDCFELTKQAAAGHGINPLYLNSHGNGSYSFTYYMMYNWVTFGTYKSQPYPASQSDFDKLPAPPLPALVQGFNKLPQLAGQPIPITGLKFPPYSEWMGDPYFKDGQWWRDRMDISPSPTTSSPTRVKVDIGPVKIQGQTNPEVVPDTGTAGGGASQPKEKPSFCEANPGSIACQEMGELKQEPFEPIEKPFNITPQNPWGSGDAQCPAPKVMHLTTGSTVTLSYQPACDFFRGVRPAVLALALLAALYIALGIPVGKGD
ncbi:virulence factor TspB C-terminal domain-related protein [Aeromonas veronii]|uniref:virulence factor TspB C-terminal domain-related protein n=1 Tax=Aeromonas veronii TaxID=654 RepID=UPI003D1E11A5